MNPLRYLVLLLCTLGFAGQSRAGLDPEMDKPYQLQVVLRIAEHRLLTPFFRDQVEQELRDSLQSAFADVARVTVVRDHPRLKDIDKLGLQAALNAWQEVSPVKTHFVFIDFSDGQYEVQALQHDGLTGQSSAVIQRERTPDRQLVARAAALVVGRDFGVVGTVVDVKKARNVIDAVTVSLKGSKLGTPPDGWARKGDVFSLVQIGQSVQQSQQAYPVRWALLRVEEEPDKGTCLCKIYHRHPDPLAEGGGIAGYRCLKLTTTRAPLHLRIVKRGTAKPTPEPNLRVHVQRRGFGDDERLRVEGVTDQDGFLSTEKKTEEPFEQVAFVKVLGADGGLLAKIPIPIVDERTVVIALDIKAEALAPLIIRKDLWLQRLYESLRGQDELFKELRELVGKEDQRATVLEKAQAGYKGIQQEIANFAQTREALHNDTTVKLDLSEGEQRLSQLQAGQAKLEVFIGEQEKIVKQGNDPKWKDLQAKAQKAYLLEGEADFEGALALYEEVVRGGVTDKTLQDHLQVLKARWKLSDNPRHKTAREFVYREWPTFDLAQLKGRTETAQQSFEVCRDAHDVLTPQKLLKVALEHAGKLRERAAALKPDDNEEDRKRAQQITEISEPLGRLIKEVNDYLQKELKSTK